MARRIERCHICKGSGLIVVDDWLTDGMTKDEVERQKQDAVRELYINEFADRLIRYYESLNGGTASGLVAYHVNKIREEMLKKEDNT